jgi:outer membrane protein assembly factor BamE (lipoprotein component of BamABCDE complex)
MKTCLIAAMSLILTACAGSSPRIDPARLSELQKGQTTVAEIVRQFGRPGILSKNPDGTQWALYVHSDGQSVTTMVPLLATAPVDSVTFYFDTNGVLTDYKTRQADPGKTTQTTTNKPTPGNVNTFNLPGWLPSPTIQNR